jgi:hypothetical protein
MTLKEHPVVGVHARENVLHAVAVFALYPAELGLVSACLISEGKCHYLSSYLTWTCTLFLFLLQEADFGPHGKFWLSISGDGSNMSWETELENINDLGEDIQNLNYHLHAQWNLNEDYATTDCGTASGHYDPFLACGPATAAKADCAALGRTSDQSYEYSCKGAYDDEEYARCEVGDLSGKYGAIPIDKDGYGFKSVKDDPLPAMNYHYQPVLSDVSDGTEVASIVFHNLAPRILCGKLNRIN